MRWWEWVIAGGVIWVIAIGFGVAFMRGAHVDDEEEWT